MFSNNESQFDPSFKHSSRYSQTAARYGKNEPRDVENGNWASQQQAMNLMQNAPPAINIGRGNGNTGIGMNSNNRSYNQQYHQQQHKLMQMLQK